ncbi:ABC transporter substrate-binding protein [Aromatoleum petrolei]|nr:ABC transporter substrate-binding protein [Aromatoleum petrolei]QTQ38407.1 Uncharacterized protein ToN1_43080 [Aromatoleum petrolei]
MEFRKSAAAIIVALAAANTAVAAEPLKIGMVLPMSGPFASDGK